MNLDALISAANWLYEHCPAGRFTEADNAILVYGEGELADALFEMLFTTAYERGRTIDLVRVSRDAQEKGFAFIGRNPDALEYFARIPIGDQDLRRPLSIHFLDEDSDWRSFRYAYAFLPKDVPLECATGALTALEDIPALRSKGETWSAEDEADVRVLRIARRVHTAYTIGWNDRYREEDLSRELYGRLGEEGDSDYALRSSMRLAVSIPWKMKMVNASSAAELAKAVRGTKRNYNGHTAKDYLAWQEHRSWQAFMTLDQWRMPTDEEMDRYMFRDGNDDRNKVEKLHPCLCDLENDDWFDAPRELSDASPSDWARLYDEAMDQFCTLDRMSLEVHHRCEQIVLSKAYRDEMQAAFNTLERALITCHPPRVDIHFGRLRSMEKLFERLSNNETNSNHPFELASQLFIEGVLRAGRESGGDMGPIRAAYKAVQSKAGLAIERNNYSDYKEIDSRIIEWLPWIIEEGKVDTIWKLYAPDSYFENVISTMILRPRRLVLVCKDRRLSVEKLSTFRQILSQHGLTEEDVTLESIALKDLDEGRLDFGDSLPELNCVDVSNAEASLQSNVVVPEGAREICLEKGILYDTNKSSRPQGPVSYCKQIGFTIDEVIQIKGNTVLSLDENNDTLGMEDDYLDLWKLCTELKSGGAGNKWEALFKVLERADEGIRQPIYREKEGRGFRDKEYRNLRDDFYEVLIRNGGLRTLYDMQRRRAISRLIIDPENKWIGLRLFPHEYSEDLERKEDYTDSEKTVEDIIYSDESGQFAMDVGYQAVNRPVHVYDLNRPIRVEGADANARLALSRLAAKGLILPQQNADEYKYKTVAVRHALKERGFALEAYVYYTLFLSGRFDDVRSNVRIKTEDVRNNELETELDVLVIKNGVMGLISCKDRPRVNKKDEKTGKENNHVLEFVEQAKKFGIGAKPILVCAHYNMENRPNHETLWPLDDLTVMLCQASGVKLIGYDALDPRDEDAKKRLVDTVEQFLLQR